MPQLQLIIHDDMVEYIKDDITPDIGEGCVDNPWWMDTDNGQFTVKLVYELIRRKKGCRNGGS